MVDDRTGLTAMGHIRHLAGKIGPRPPTSDGEQRAADYVAGVLRDMGGEVSVQQFSSHRTFSHNFGIIYTLGALAGLLTPVYPVVGLVAGLFTLILFWREVDTRGFVWRICPQGRSQNVIGRFPARKEAKGRVVLLAHHDTSRSAILFAPDRVGGFRISFLLMAGSFALIPILAGAAASLAPGLGRIIGLMALLPGLYLAGSAAVLVHRELAGADVDGANDNASGVGVMLEAAASLPLRHSEVWVVSTGAEEAGSTGALALIREFGNELGGALFINLDNVGAGNPRYTTGEGMLSFFRSDPQLVELARRVSQERPDLGFDGVDTSLMSTDAVPLMARGFRCISLRAEDDQRRLPNWHWPTDTVENVEQRTIANMVSFASELLNGIDRGWS